MIFKSLKQKDILEGKFRTMIYDALEIKIKLKDITDIFKESAKPKELVRKEKKALTHYFFKQCSKHMFRS